METTLNKKKAYKAFNVDSQNRLYCKNKYYTIGVEATQDGKLKICSNGIHFCWELNDINEFYSLLGEDVVIGEIEVLGDIINASDMKKSCTNRIKLTKLLTNEEVLRISNSGRGNSGTINSGFYNSGFYNSGNFNSGNYNSGNYNSGNRNSGYCNSGNDNSGYYNSGNDNSGNRNSGNRNSGNYNSGNRNSGNYNSGSRNSGSYNYGNYNSGSCNYGNYNSGSYNSGSCNSGNRNSGDYNSGDCNSGDWSFGCFNTESSKINLFNRLSDMTQSDWISSEHYSVLVNTGHRLTEWIEYTDEQKASDKVKELIGGYLKTYSDKEAYQIWWSELSEKDKAVVLTIPNFDKDVFFEITGVAVES